MNDRIERAEAFDDEYDVVVVGARCAGAATSMLLARAGLSVLTVDRSGYGADTLSTQALTRPGVLQLSRWGVLDQVRLAGTPRIDTVAYRYGDEDVTVAITPDGDVDGLYAPRRSVLDRILVDAAVGAGATVSHRTTVRDLVRGPDRRVCGVRVERGGAVTEIRCRMVIGADGARSSVARRGGASFERRDAACSATIYTFVPGLADHAYLNVFGPSMAAGVIPTNDGHANVWVAVGAERFEREARRDVAGFFRRQLERADPLLGAHVARQETPRIRSFPGLAGFSRRAWGPGWALVGDAVSFRDPVSAHGMTDAFIGAEILARHVVDTFHGADESVALAEYAAVRSSIAAPMTDAVAFLATYEWDPVEVQPAHLAMNRAMRDEWSFLTSLDSPGARLVDGRAAA